MNKQAYKEKHNELLERWNNARPDYSKNGNWFCEDGIVNFEINYETWNAQVPKILFLVKDDHSGWSPGICKFDVKGKFGLNIARWRYLIIEMHKNYINNIFNIIKYPDTNRELILDDLTDIAVVEVKKKVHSGKTICTPYEVLEYAEQDAEFLREQINLIGPDIILLGNTVDAYGNYIYGDDGWTELREISNCSCLVHKNRLVINFFHPSARKSPEKMFDILQDLLKWEEDEKTHYIFKEFKWV